jgi:hypothetical protein
LGGQLTVPSPLRLGFSPDVQWLAPAPWLVTRRILLAAVSAALVPVLSSVLLDVAHRLLLGIVASACTDNCAREMRRSDDGDASMP